jgi:hypothetical protein
LDENRRSSQIFSLPHSGFQLILGHHSFKLSILEKFAGNKRLRAHGQNDGPCSDGFGFLPSAKLNLKVPDVTFHSRNLTLQEKGDKGRSFYFSFQPIQYACCLIAQGVKGREVA